MAKAWSLHSTTASAPLGISNLALSPTSPGCEALSLIGQVSDGELNVELQGAPQQKCTLAFSATIEAGRVPLATFNDEDDRPVTVKLSGASPPLVSGSTRGSLHVGLRQAEGRFLNPVELANIASLGGELAESAFRFAGGSRSVCSAARGQRIILERDGWKIESVELRGGSFVVRARVEAPQLSICPAELVALEPRHCSSEPEPGCHFDVAQYWKWVSYVAGALAGVVALVLSILGFKGPGT